MTRCCDWRRCKRPQRRARLDRRLPPAAPAAALSAALEAPPVPAHILGSLKAAESMNAGGDGGNGARPRRTKAEERLASAQLEHDSLVRMFDSTAPADADDQLQRTLHLSEVVAKLDAAKAQVEEEAKRTKEKALPSGEDLLLLTRTNIFARQHSDEATIASVDGESTGAGTPLAGGTKPKFEFPDPRTVRSFAVQDATAAAKARKAAAEAAVEGASWLWAWRTACCPRSCWRATEACSW